jgi:hypothetical protein
VSVVCDNLTWSPVAVAPSHSALAAVLAGFVFAGVVMILGQARTAGYHPRSLTLLISSFFVLTLDSFLFSVIGGERDCSRAWTEMMIGAGLLGIGTLGVFGGIAWLALDRSDRYAHASRYITVLTRWIAAIIPMYLLITTLYYLDDTYGPELVPIWLRLVAWGCPAAVLAAVLTVTVAQLRGRWRPGEWNIKIAAYSSVAYGIASAFCFGGLSGPGDAHSGTPIWTVATAVIFALALSALATVTHVLALPPTRARPKDERSEPFSGGPVTPSVPAARNRTDRFGHPVDSRTQSA